MSPFKIIDDIVPFYVVSFHQTDFLNEIHFLYLMTDVPGLSAFWIILSIKVSSTRKTIPPAVGSNTRRSEMQRHPIARRDHPSAHPR